MPRRGPYKSRPEPGTVAALVVAFRDSPQFRGWGPVWQDRSDRRLATFARFNGRRMVATITRGEIVQIRDSLADTPSMANAWLVTLRALFDYAVDLEWMDSNPAASVKKLAKANPDGFPAWDEAQIARFLAHHCEDSTPHRVARLILNTGAARVDLVALGWQNIRGDRIQYRRSKMLTRGGVLVDLPILPDLAALLETLPRDRLTFLATIHGTPRAAEGLSRDMTRWTADAGLPLGLNCHGLRKALARRLAEAGSPPQEIMAWLGQKSMAMAAFYSASFSRARAADAGAERLANISPPKIIPIGAKKP